MRHQVARGRKAAQQDTTASGTIRRILKHLFDIEPATIDGSATLGDFESYPLANTAGALTPTGWRTRVRDRVYFWFGVDCDIDEPLSVLAARIELAERGVHCTLVH